MLDRSLGALVGGALGDALGMPTQLLSPAQIKASYGFVDSFISPSDDHPVSKGLPAGAVTDDTEQTLLLGRILLESGASFDHKRWVNALIAWERDVKLRGWGHRPSGQSTPSTAVSHRRRPAAPAIPTVRRCASRQSVS